MALLALTQECLDAAEGKLPQAPILEDGRKGKRPMRLQVFQNRFIEKWFAQAHPITPGIWFGGIVIYGLYAGLVRHGWLALPLFLAGVLFISLVEYGLHRWLFHFTAHTKEERLRLFLLHGYHHDFPNDPMRLVLPPIAIWPVAAIFITVYWFAFGSYFWPIAGGSALGYIAYDWVHYYTHHFMPKSRAGKFIKRYHMLHHHDSPGQRYGITSPLWDLVFGTYLPTNVMARKPGAGTAPASQSH
ncbi:MAG: hypothetical protein EOP08_11920 [Proteobacteria bacterium]|nr:MAG: hypothetical protein EOP08_11920 [Pseudomonadota bacterium]